MKQPLRLASLLRVSTPGQVEEGYGLDDQQRGVQALYSRTGHYCVETLIDGGVSGKVRDRPAVKRVLELLTSGQIQGVVTPRVDRIGRGAHIIHDILHTIRSAGGVVLYADLELPEGPAGILLENVLIGLAEYDHANIRARTMNGRMEKARAGKFPAQLKMFGYRLITKAEATALPQYAGRDGELELVEREAEVIRELYERAAAGASLYALAAWLAERGVMGTRGGPPTTVLARRWLRNSAYKGLIRYGANEWRPKDARDKHGQPLPYDGKRRVTAVPRSDGGVLIPCPAIVSSELWEQVQGILDETAEAHSLRGPRTYTYRLRGAIFCASCKRQDGQPARMHGRRKTTNSQRKGYYRLDYACERCFRSVSAEKAEQYALKTLRLRLDPDLAEARVRAEYAAKERGRDDLAVQIQKVQAELRACAQDEDRVGEMIRAGLSADAVARQVARIKERQAAACKELARLEASAGDTTSEEAAVARARLTVMQLCQDLEAAEADPQRLMALFQRYVRVFVGTNGRLMVRTAGF